MVDGPKDDPVLVAGGESLREGPEESGELFNVEVNCCSKFSSSCRFDLVTGVLVVYETTEL